MVFDATHQDTELPEIDDRLAPPESRYEVLDGELVYVPPADGPHGTRHSIVSALVEAHAAADFQVASDMLTRTSKIDDVAPDVSVFPRAPHPVTGRRQLEQLAFEVVSTQSLSYAGRKASKLAGRGVRRVFAIDIARGRALEWSRALQTWAVLDPGGWIEDAALGAPLPIHALIHAASADDVMAQALLTKGNPVLEAARAQDRAEGRAEGRGEGRMEGWAEGHAEGREEGGVRGRAAALLVILRARGFSPGASERARILDELDASRIERWIARAVTCADLDELFAEP
jgi:Uma2 family endonuclease